MYSQSSEKGARYPQKDEGEPSDNLYICGLPDAFETESVKQFFGAIGNVTQAKSFGHGFALVRFASVQEAMTVRQSLNGQKPIGCVKPLVITFAASAKKDDWTCPRCGDLQFEKNKQCRLCGCPRPKPGEEVGAGASEGDWACPSCGDLQFKRNTSCRLCGTPAPGPGGESSSLPLPVFGKANQGKGKGAPAGPYGKSDKGCGKVKGGPMCSIAEFVAELITGGLPGGDYDPSQNLLYVAGLPPDTTSENLYQIFATFGPLPPKGCRVETLTTGQCDGTGSLNFMEAVHADMAVMALNGIGLPGGGKLEVVKR